MCKSFNNRQDSYTGKGRDYFSIVRHDILRFIKPSDSVLEIGCGDGSTLVYLKSSGIAREVWGVDIMDFGQNQRLDHYIHCDIENREPDIPVGYFDIIIIADVLEHLINPWDTLRRIKMYLKDDGLLISSIPNFREINVLADIFFRGDFRYTETGILDKTHLRFFCRKNIAGLFQYAGLRIEKISENLESTNKRRFLNKLTFGLLEEFLVINYIILARKDTN